MASPSFRVFEVREFGADGADLILRSISSTQGDARLEFRVHRALLSIVSPALRTVIDRELSQLSETSFSGDNLPHVSLPESDATIEALLRFIYPTVLDPTIDSFDDIVPILEAALKYELKTTVLLLIKILKSPQYMETNALRVFALALRFDLDDVAIEASSWTLKMDPIMDIPPIDDLKYLSSRALFVLIDLRRKRVGKMTDLLRDMKQHFNCFSCQAAFDHPDPERQSTGIGYTLNLKMAPIRDQARQNPLINPFPEPDSIIPLPTPEQLQLFARGTGIQGVLNRHFRVCYHCRLAAREYLIGLRDSIDLLPTSLDSDTLQSLKTQTHTLSPSITSILNSAQLQNQSGSPEDIHFGYHPADVILRSCSNANGVRVNCHVHKAVLSFTSSFFKNMFEVGQEDRNGAVPIIDMAESADVLQSLLKCIYTTSGFITPFEMRLEELPPVWLMAQKFDIPLVTKVLEKVLLSENSLEKQPLQVYAVASLLQLERVKTATLRHTLSYDLRPLPKSLEIINAYDYHTLLRLHKEQSKLAIQLLKQRQNDLVLCSRCLASGSETPKWWTNYTKIAKQTVHSKLSLDTIFDMSFIAKAMDSNDCLECALSLVKSHKVFESLKEKVKRLPLQV